MKVIPYTKDAGFTLIETIVTVIIAGILAAVAAPNFYGLLKSNEVNEGIASLENALKEAQKIAIRESKQCTVTINAGTKNITANPTDCLPTSRSFSDDVDMAINTAPATTTTTIDIDFAYKGNIIVEDIGGTNTTSSTIVISSNFTSNAKCLFVPESIGGIKVGDYSGSNCNATPD